MHRASVSLNGTTYHWPVRPVVVVCVDGGDPAYFEADLEKGVIPNTARFMSSGFNASEHDLSGLAGHRLRSHGAIAEAKVPFVLNKPINATYAARAAKGGLRTFHVFDFAVNGVAS